MREYRLQKEKDGSNYHPQFRLNWGWIKTPWVKFHWYICKWTKNGYKAILETDYSSNPNQLAGFITKIVATQKLIDEAGYHKKIVVDYNYLSDERINYTAIYKTKMRGATNILDAISAYRVMKDSYAEERARDLKAAKEAKERQKRNRIVNLQIND